MDLNIRRLCQMLVAGWLVVVSATGALLAPAVMAAQLSPSMSVTFPAQITVCDTSITISFSWENFDRTQDTLLIEAYAGTGLLTLADSAELTDLPASGSDSVTLQMGDLSQSRFGYVDVRLYRGGTGILSQIDEQEWFPDILQDCDAAPEPTATTGPTVAPTTTTVPTEVVTDPTATTVPSEPTTGAATPITTVTVAPSEPTAPASGGQPTGSGGKVTVSGGTSGGAVAVTKLPSTGSGIGTTSPIGMLLGGSLVILMAAGIAMMRRHREG